MLRRKGNDIMDAIKNMIARRSVRVYTEEQISDEELKTILECGLYAPNGGNLQMPRFLVVQSPAKMEELNRVIQRELASRELVDGQMMNRGILRARKEGYHFIHHAPTLISAVAPHTYGNAMADCACALENMQLAAAALGLGACWSNQPHWLTDVPALRACFEKLGLREDEDIFGSVSIGHIGYEAAKAAPRKPDRVQLDMPRELD